MVVEEKTAELSELPPLEEIRGPATRRAGFLGWLLYYSPGILFIAALIALWHALWHFQVFAEQYISNPVQVFWTFVELIRTDHPEVQLFGNVLASLKAQVTGFLLGGLVGIPLGILIGSAEFARRLLMPFIRFIYPIPGIAWVPFAILWFGAGQSATVFAIFITAIFPMLVNTMVGVSSLENQYVRVMQVFGTPRWMAYRRVIIPGAFPFILAGIRLGYGVGWRVIVGAEMLSAIAGLGYLIDRARWAFLVHEVIVGIITIGIIGLTVESVVFDFLERKTLRRWGVGAQQL